jgi:phosphatidylethanolamine-binding protein (PEBP) family uncharacterized protein
MKLTSTSLANNQKISGEFAFCVPDPAHHVCLGSNKNPQLAWSDVPVGAKSFAIICHDPDVPSKGDDVNQEGRSVPASLPRVDFFHWDHQRHDHRLRAVAHDVDDLDQRIDRRPAVSL